MKLSEIYHHPQGMDKPQSKVFYFELDDPKSGDYTEAAIRAYFNYDNGDVGFGTGPGKSPYQPSWDFDYAVVEKPFEFMGQRFKAGQHIDMEDFADYMDPRRAEDMFPTDELGDEDEGY